MWKAGYNVADGSTGAAIDRVDGERLFPSKAMRCAERGRLQHGCRLTRVEAAMARQAGELVDLQTEGKASAARLQRMVEGLEQMGDILGEERSQMQPGQGHCWYPAERAMGWDTVDSQLGAQADL